MKMAKSNGTTAMARAADSVSDELMYRPIVYKAFLGTTDIVLSASSVLKLLAKPTRSGALPTPAQAIRFAKLCEARGLNPWEGDAYLVGFDTRDGAEFNLITAHQAFLKRAEVHPEFDGMESGVVVEDDSGGDKQLLDQAGDFIANGQTLAGGWARVHFKNRKIPTYRRVNLSTFNTGRSRWEKDPGGMIVKCAEADALRSSFPTKLGGMYLREEMEATEMDAAAGEMRDPVPMPRAVVTNNTLSVDAPWPEPAVSSGTLPDSRSGAAAPPAATPRKQPAKKTETDEPSLMDIAATGAATGEDAQPAADEEDQTQSQPAEDAGQQPAGNGGDETQLTPREKWSADVDGLLAALKADPQKFKKAMDAFLLSRGKLNKGWTLTAEERQQLAQQAAKRTGSFADIS